MEATTYRARPLAKARLPFVQPRRDPWRSAPPRGAVLGAVAASLSAVGALAVRRVWRRGSASRHAAGHTLVQRSRMALSETGEVAVEGYRSASWREQAAFNTLVSFVVTIVASRTILYTLEERRPIRP